MAESLTAPDAKPATPPSPLRPSFDGGHGEVFSTPGGVTDKIGFVTDTKGIGSGVYFSVGGLKLTAGFGLSTFSPSGDKTLTNNRAYATLGVVNESPRIGPMSLLTTTYVQVGAAFNDKGTDFMTTLGADLGIRVQLFPNVADVVVSGAIEADAPGLGDPARNVRIFVKITVGQNKDTPLEQERARIKKIITETKAARKTLAKDLEQNAEATIDKWREDLPDLDAEEKSILEAKKILAAEPALSVDGLDAKAGAIGDGSRAVLRTRDQAVKVLLLENSAATKEEQRSAVVAQWNARLDRIEIERKSPTQRVTILDAEIDKLEDQLQALEERARPGQAVAGFFDATARTIIAGIISGHAAETRKLGLLDDSLQLQAAGAVILQGPATYSCLEGMKALPGLYKLVAGIPFMIGGAIAMGWGHAEQEPFAVGVGDMFAVCGLQGALTMIFPDDEDFARLLAVEFSVLAANALPGIILSTAGKTQDGIPYLANSGGMFVFDAMQIYRYVKDGTKKKPKGEAEAAPVAKP